MARAEAALAVLRSLRHHSLAVPVCVGDERRYVGHQHVRLFWAVRPYLLCEPSTEAEAPSGADLAGGAAPTGGNSAGGTRTDGASSEVEAWVASDDEGIDGNGDGGGGAAMSKAAARKVECRDDTSPCASPKPHRSHRPNPHREPHLT